jgi:hypothetical protein
MTDTEQECWNCGSPQGPDRRARYEAGDPDLDSWEECKSCGEPLCDSCATGSNHRCDYLDR